jgi:uncharacterized protein with PhoU and TrkA domain
MRYIEHIIHNGEHLAAIIRAEMAPDQTLFITPSEFKQQVGFVVYPAGGEIARHVHLPIERHLTGTSEVLIVKRGRCLADIYDNTKQLIVTKELHKGDILLMVSGGHGFRMLEKTIFLEIKQGPYTGLAEKERF